MVAPALSSHTDEIQVLFIATTPPSLVMTHESLTSASHQHLMWATQNLLHRIATV